jgi:D-psicose/D-tagatose/L-ribulose 3-epimerase
MSYLAISDIGWSDMEGKAIFRLMRENGFLGLETTPTRISNNVDGIGNDDVSEFKAYVNKMGLDIVALQALLYGRPDLVIFDDKNTREKTMKHLEKCVDIGEKLGASALVFGAPKNRNIPENRINNYLDIAIDFFDRIGKYSLERGLFFCLEPNPKVYGTNFICTTDEAVDFVRLVGNRGLRVNLDIGTIITNNENYSVILDKEVISLLGHIHVSEPFLVPLDSSRDIHRKLPGILRAAKYSGDVSIEMKKVVNGDIEDHIRGIGETLNFVKMAYG